MSVMHCSHIAHLAPDDFEGVEFVSGVSTPLEAAIAAAFVVTATITDNKRNEALTQSHSFERIPRMQENSHYVKHKCNPK